jgi:hypothetical protein
VHDAKLLPQSCSLVCCDKPPAAGMFQCFQQKAVFFWQPLVRHQRKLCDYIMQLVRQFPQSLLTSCDVHSRRPCQALALGTVGCCTFQVCNVLRACCFPGFLGCLAAAEVGFLEAACSSCLFACTALKPVIGQLAIRVCAARLGICACFTKVQCTSCLLLMQIVGCSLYIRSVLPWSGHSLGTDAEC